MMPTFGQLKTYISRNLVRPDLLADQTGSIDDTISDSIRSAIDKYRMEKLSFLESFAAFNIALNAGTFALPTDFVSDIAVIINNSPKTTKIDKTQFAAIIDAQSTFSTSPIYGFPRSYATFNGTAYIYPLSSTALTGTIFYYRRLPDLVDDLDTNGWTENASRLIINQAMADIYRLRGQKSDLYQTNEAEAAKELNRLQTEYTRRNDSGFVQLPYVY